VVARFDRAVKDASAAAGNRELMVVTHGQAMTLWLSDAAGLADPKAFWAALTFPDAWLVSPGSLRRASRTI
jgi:hypothetical protein